MTTVEVVCHSHGVQVVEVSKVRVGADGSGPIVGFVCPAHVAQGSERTAVLVRVGHNRADWYVAAGAVDLRPGHGVVPEVVCASVRRPPHPVPPQAPARSRLDREYSDPARGYSNRITEDEFFEFVRLLEDEGDPAAFAARQMRGAAS